MFSRIPGKKHGFAVLDIDQASAAVRTGLLLIVPAVLVGLAFWSAFVDSAKVNAATPAAKVGWILVESEDEGSVARVFLSLNECDDALAKLRGTSSRTANGLQAALHESIDATVAKSVPRCSPHDFTE